MDENKIKELQDLYTKYVKEILTIETKEQILAFSSRKTLSSTMIASTRANETKVIDAIKGSNYVEGDRFYTFFLEDDSLCLAENFKGEYNKTRLLASLHDTITVFDSVLPVKELFPNYALKRNQKLLETL